MNANESIGKVLKINLTTGEISIQPMDIAFARTYLGGRGYTSRLQYDLIPKKVDPLGPENILIFAPGALTGTPALSSSRIVVGGRSPLTGILGDANSGGFFGPTLRRAGYGLMLIYGQAEHPVYILINEDQVEIRDARHLWGKEVHETTDLLQDEHGKAFQVAAIGPAGERLVRISAIMCDKEHGAARTGLGAVMGSKNLKAIAARSTKPVPMADAAHFNELAAELREIENNDKRAQDFKRRGTLGTLMDHHTELGGTNTRNFQFGQFEGKKKIDQDALAASYQIGTVGCYRCSLKCDRLTKVTDGEYAGVTVGGPEYCTAVSFGSGVGVDNLAAILKGNDLANRYGLDTIDLGGVIAFAFELFQRGILTTAETGGLDLTWGNYHSVLELTRQIAYREGFGDVLADGLVPAAQAIGKNSQRYAVQVKGMAPAPLDARAVKVYNFRYAVGPRGADHLRISAPGAYGLDQVPFSEAAEKLRYWESIIAIPDLMGICKFAYTYYTETVEKTLYRTLKIVPQLYTAVTGYDLTDEDLLEAGSRVTNIERAHTSRLGLTAADDTLPPRFTEDVMPEGPAKGKIYDILESFKRVWYETQGWNIETGVPRRKCLEDLGLKDIADDLEKNGLDIS